MDAVRGNPYSHLTAKERDRLSFPARIALERGWLRGRVLDFGCGLGSDVQHLAAQGIDVVGYDPHYAPDLSPPPASTPSFVSTSSTSSCPKSRPRC